MLFEHMPLLADRAVLIIVAKLDDKTLRVNVILALAKADENVALTTRLTYTGPPEELDAELGKRLVWRLPPRQLRSCPIVDTPIRRDAIA